MRVFVAGASGVLGVRIVPLLVAAGHEVAGMTRTPGKAASLLAMGATPVICDVYDRAALQNAIAAFRPDVVMHQLTDLPDDVTRIAELRASNIRIRSEGTANLIDAARAAGAARFVAQSIAWATSVVAEHERRVLEIGGVVLRYGQLYGPDTYFEGDPPDPPRVHVDDAARRTLDTLELASGIVVITGA